MKTPRSPVFVEDDDDVLKPGERWASDKVLGSGNHASAELKLAFLRLFQMFEDRELVLSHAVGAMVPVCVHITTFQQGTVEQ